MSQIKTGDLGKNEFDTKSLILCEGGEWLRVSGQLDWQEGNNVDICTTSHRIRPTIAHTQEPSYDQPRAAFAQIVDYLIYTGLCHIIDIKCLIVLLQN